MQTVCISQQWCLWMGMGWRRSLWHAAPSPAEQLPAWNAGRVSHERQSETHVTPSLTLLGFTFVKAPVVLDGDIFDHFSGLGLTPLH